MSEFLGDAHRPQQAGTTATGTRCGQLRLPQPVTDPAVAAQGLTKLYGRGDTAVKALDNVDVSIAGGKLTAIMGPSGSGKSTLMHCLAGLESITAGHITIGDTRVDGMSQRQLTRLRRDRIGFIFQAFNLVPTLSAAENITLPSDIAHRKVDRERFEKLTQTLGLTDRLTHRPNELSGGQQQRVAIARALVSAPQVVFADEPTGNLDSHSTDQVLRYLRHVVDEYAQTVVMVTHEAQAAATADTVLFLSDGRVVAQLDNPDEDSVLAALRVVSDPARLEEALTAGLPNNVGMPEGVHDADPATTTPSPSPANPTSPTSSVATVAAVGTVAGTEPAPASTVPDIKDLGATEVEDILTHSGLDLDPAAAAAIADLLAHTGSIPVVTDTQATTTDMGANSGATSAAPTEAGGIATASGNEATPRTPSFIDMMPEPNIVTPPASDDALGDIVIDPLATRNTPQAVRQAADENPIVAAILERASRKLQQKHAQPAPRIIDSADTEGTK